jgi:lipopolysaccharide/colanic/teichoic acid biosynthesis glycosyltransferase
VALAVRITSPGPILFRQQRLGRSGRKIPVLKFRTMVVDAEERLRSQGLWDHYVECGYKLPADEDCRITPVGRFLRKTSLDELPQLFNVLRGDMSLVGPRPIVPDELRCYGALAHCYLSVRPGITGLWQITGRSTIGFPERAQIDDEYYRRRSLAADLRILARTPAVVLRCTGAY